MPTFDTRRHVRQVAAWSVGLLSLGTLTGVLATVAPNGAGPSLVLRPAHLVSVSNVPKGGTPSAAAWASTNWSGYAETATTYKSVTGQWTVPAVSGPNGSYSAAWIGIDGYNDNYLIQTGTEQDYSGGAQYSAWWTTSSQNFAEQTITSGCTTYSSPQSGAAGNFAVARYASLRSRTRGFPPPTVSIGGATNVTSSSATLNGTVNPNGSSTTYYFEWGTTSLNNSTTITSAGSGTRAVAVHFNLTGLSASTTYEYALVASSSRGSATSATDSFTTSGSGSGGGGGGSGTCGAVAAGDVMNASISDAAGSSWTITISDATQKWTFTINVTYTGPGASAEWILEAPSLCYGNRCQVGTLANYGTAVFDPGTSNGGNPGLSPSDSGEMVNSTGTQVISSPSNPDSDTDGFAVAYGSVQPNPPSS
jgi:hypothetical protein